MNNMGKITKYELCDQLITELKKIGEIDDVKLSLNTIKDNIGDDKDLPTELQGKSLTEMIKTNFTNVSNGKSLLASAITDKGIPTLANDNFNTMATNVKNIKTGYASGENIPLDKLNIEYTRDSDPLLIKQKGIGSSVRNLTEVQISQDRQYAYFRYYDTWGYSNLLIYNIKKNSTEYTLTKKRTIYFTAADTFILTAFYDPTLETSYMQKRNLNGSLIWNKQTEDPSDGLFADYFNNRIYSLKCSYSNVQYINILDSTGVLISKIYTPNLTSTGVSAIYNNKLYYSDFTEIYNLNNDNIIQEPNESLEGGLNIIRELEQGKYLCKKINSNLLYEYNLKNNTLVKSYNVGDYIFIHADIDKNNEYIYFLPINNGRTDEIAKYSIKTNSLIYKKSLLINASESCGIAVENEGDIYKFTHYTQDPVIMQYMEEGKILSSISIK